MECKDCKMFKDCTNVTDEVCNDFKAADRNEGFDNITNIVPEEIEETDKELNEEDKELNESAERAKNSIHKLIDTIITETVKKSSDTPKAPKTTPQKRSFKIGFWGYLTIAAVIKGTVDIARAVADAKRPRK